MAGAFSRAVKGISINVNSEGRRTIGRNAAMDREGGGGSRSYSDERETGNRNYNDRGSNTGGRWQRGNFRARGGRGRGRGRSRGNRGYQGSFNQTSRFDNNDDDASMDGRNNRGRFDQYGRGGRGDGGRDRSPTTKTGWYKVIIPDGCKQDRQWLLQRLKNIVTKPFEPKSIHNIKETVAFFVDNETAANALREANKVITTRDGDKIVVIVKSSDPPKDRSGGFSGRNPGSYKDNKRNLEVENSPEKIETLKEFLGNRYDLDNVKLDLANLHSDKTLRGGDIDTRIWQPKLMNTILQLVNKLCPNLKIMDISNNRLQRLDILLDLGEKCPELQELNLSNNGIRFVDELGKLQSSKKLTKLWFDNNPAKEQYNNDDAGYVAAIRSFLPGVLELDGVELPPPITFGLAKIESSLPTSQLMYTTDKKASDLVVKFLKDFFQAYDAIDVNDRQRLLDVYHNDAVFSMSCNLNVTTNENHKNLNDYISLSRNLKVLKDKDVSFKNNLIKNKKLNVVARLTELPQTKHQLDTFSFDVPIATPSCLVFTVQGVFLEGKEMTPRGFARSFVVVYKSDKFLIVNDQLHVRQVTDKQLQKITVAPENTSTGGIGGVTADQKEMVKKFSEGSGMNLKFTLDCLESNNWNYEVAAKAFSNLKENGKIPPEAFIK